MNCRLLVFASAGALWLAGAAIAQQQPDWNAIQVTAQPIKPGVAVLFGNGGNIGVSYGEDGTFIVDDQFAPLAPKIQAAIAGLGASPVKYLVNTHWHFDHAGGNEPFGNAGAIIVAQSRVRDRLAAGGTVAGNNSPPAPKAALPVVTYDRGVTFHINGDTLKYEAYTAAGKLYDAFDLQKTPNGKSKLQNRIPPVEENRRPVKPAEKK